jgi:hypothetical protein
MRLSQAAHSFDRVRISRGVVPTPERRAKVSLVLLVAVAVSTPRLSPTSLRVPQHEVVDYLWTFDETKLYPWADYAAIDPRGAEGGSEILSYCLANAREINA